MIVLAFNLAIYRELIRHSNDLANVEKIQDIYSCASYFIRLPGYIPIPSFISRPSDIIDVSLVVRKSKMSRTQVFNELGIPLDSKVVLISFGGHELFQTGKDGGWTADRVLPPSFIGVIVGPGRQVENHGGRLVAVRSQDWYLPDLINAVDVVLSKWYLNLI